MKCAKYVKVAMAFVFVLALSFYAKAPVYAQGKAYYVSSIHGNNANDGMSPEQAFETLDKLQEVVSSLKPGDKILLESGSVFNGYIHLKDVSGEKGNPIIISSYGQGNKPVINAQGQGLWFQDYGKPLGNAKHKYRGYVSSTILLYDVDYVEVSNLELVNTSTDSYYFDKDKAALTSNDKIAEKLDRTGVAGIAKNGGTMNHVYLDNLYIHDIDGNIQNKHMDNGGIQINVLAPDNEAETGIARLNDIKISNSTVEKASRAGIAVGYTYQYGKFRAREIADDVVEKYGHTNILITNNYVKDVGNDGIVVLYAHRPLVQYNVSDHAGVDMIKHPSYWQSTNAAIWPWKTKDAIFQYNEAFDTVFNADGQAWDIDSSDGTIYQYNYSHNNGGGTVMFCLEQAYNGVFRYNISQNDLAHIFTFVGNPNAEVYNNVFYIDGDLETRIHNNHTRNHYSGTAVLKNNIFYNTSSRNPNDDWQAGKQTYSHNIYYGYATTPASDAHAITEDPQFVNPGSAPTAALATVHERSAFDGYKLQNTSPAINSGEYIENGAQTDFFGNKLSRMTDRGVHETDVAEDVVLDVVSPVYTVEADAIRHIPYKTSVTDFLNQLHYSKGLQLVVQSKDGVVKENTAVIEELDKLVLTHNADTKTYTLYPDAEQLRVTSSRYQVQDQTIETVMPDTSVKDFLLSLGYSDYAHVSVKNQGYAKQLDENMAENDQLIIRGESVELTYRIVVGKRVQGYEEIDPATTTGKVGSFQPNNNTEGNADLALDGRDNTMWHSNWNGADRSDLWFVLDLQESKPISMLKYSPRTGGGTNGIITKYQILTRNSDSEEWQEVSLNEPNVWALDASDKYATFNEVQARYVKLVALESSSTVAGLQFASARELRVGNVTYQEVPIDKSALEKLVAYAQELIAQNKHNELALLADAKTEAEGVLNTQDVTQRDIYSMASVLQQVINALTLKPIETTTTTVKPDETTTTTTTVKPDETTTTTTAVKPDETTTTTTAVKPDETTMTTTGVKPNETTTQATVTTTTSHTKRHKVEAGSNVTTTTTTIDNKQVADESSAPSGQAPVKVVAGLSVVNDQVATAYKKVYQDETPKLVPVARDEKPDASKKAEKISTTTTTTQETKKDVSDDKQDNQLLWLVLGAVGVAAVVGGIIIAKKRGEADA